MSFSLLPAMFAGLMGTVAMSLLAESASLKGLTTMPSTSFVIGSVFSGDQDEAMLIGNVVNFVLLGAVVYGLVYGAAVSGFDANPVAVGLGLGLIHGALVGVILGVMDGVHPRLIEPDRTMPTPPSHTAIRVAADRSEVVAIRPGPFGVNWGQATPLVLMASYGVFGLVFGFLYSMLA